MATNIMGQLTGRYSEHITGNILINKGLNSLNLLMLRITITGWLYASWHDCNIGCMGNSFLRGIFNISNLRMFNQISLLTFTYLTSNIWVTPSISNNST